MAVGFTVNIDLLGTHIHEYVHLSTFGYLIWSLVSALFYRWIAGRIIKKWDQWYDKHPLSYLIFHHHIHNHEAKAAWLCDEDGCKRVSFDDTYSQPIEHH